MSVYELKMSTSRKKAYLVWGLILCGKREVLNLQGGQYYVLLPPQDEIGTTALTPLAPSHWHQSHHWHHWHHRTDISHTTDTQTLTPLAPSHWHHPLYLLTDKNGGNEFLPISATRTIAAHPVTSSYWHWTDKQLEHADTDTILVKPLILNYWPLSLTPSHWSMHGACT